MAGRILQANTFIRFVNFSSPCTFSLLQLITEVQLESLQAWAVSVLWEMLKPKFEQELSEESMQKLTSMFHRGSLDVDFKECVDSGVAIESIDVKSFKFMQQFGVKARITFYCNTTASQTNDQ